MARSTFTSIRSRSKLSLVWIGFVTIHALGKRQRLFEISSCVTLRATSLHVFAEQREFGFGVIKALAEIAG